MGAVMGGGRGIFVVVVFVVVGGVGVCVCVGCEAGEEGFERCDVFCSSNSALCAPCHEPLSTTVP